MKNISKVFLALVLMAITSLVYADSRSPSASTGYLSSGTLIKTGQCILTGVEAMADGTNVATITVYDNTTNSGKILAKFVVGAGSYYGGRGNMYIPARKGLYVDISGTGAGAIVDYITPEAM
jgi:hypothetical protein